ncbi:Ribosomal RNA-processing protein 12 [Colletotrichum sidae]|uniref:Ribosomal RNA-processing protein 12 n=1 Tax=Colletotrichum sidae TaxID=1347389 RepID=A0A4V3I360_9PEZI|nr:Ribosomal RNA-processing protein 12 [Colletotrichum sidae]
MSTPTLAEKLDKIRSPGLQSQKRTAVLLEAVDTTLKEQNTEPTPTGYFAALLALLTQAVDSGNITSETTTSVVYLLDVVTPFAPQPLLRAKFTQILTSLAPVLLQEDAGALLLRSSIGCLESLLIAQDMSAWELGVTQIGPRRAVAGLLNISLDSRPKIRKRAQEALRNVLKNPPPSPALDHPAADMCAHTALATLEDLAGKAAQARKQKSGTESAHDPAMIHALQLIKTIASASGGWPSKKIEALCELLLGISRSGNEYMTMASFEIFEMIFEGMATDEVASAKLPRLMEIISELRPAANDTQLTPPWLAILSRGYDVSAQLEPEEVFQNLPEIFSMVTQYLESSAHNIRVSASECLVSFLANCVPKQVILEPSIYDEKTLDKLAKIAESLLSVKYQQAWMESFNVFGAMFDSLRWRAHPMMLNITKAVGDLRGNDSFQGKKEADEVLGKAIRAMGPEAVLSILPLNLAKPVRGQQGRAWMFPVLRDYVSNTNLAHFRTEMVPLSELMFQRVLDHGKAEKTLEVKIFETIVQQIWATLPGYCDLPLDLTEAFDQTFAELLANILYKQIELRLEVCRALKILVESNQAIASIEDAEEDLVLQSRVSRATAKKNLAHLGGFAANMLAVLFNVYTQTLPQSRGPILLTINAFLSVTPEKELTDTFDRVSKMLAAELQQTEQQEKPKQQQQKSKDQMPSTSNTLMDLIITISVYLPRESFSALFEIASVIIFKENEPQLQKKAYKLVPRLAESESGKVALQERTEELQQMFLTSADKVSAPARRERLGALSALLAFIPDTSLHFIPAILSEVVICCKENNERAREAAYDLLIQMGQRMESANGVPIDNTKVPHMPADAPAGKADLEEFLTMVSAGLVGSTPHMISASITALSRVLYEFRRSFSNNTLADLVQTMDLFLTSNNREIVKSVLGFIKICVLSLPSELIIPRLPTLVPNLIIWGHEHKGHFKSKVRHILERMVRKFGFDLVNKNCPENDRKLIVNIRKTKERSKKRKEAARLAGEESDDEEGRQGRKFDNELDQALYSSDSDGSGDDSDDGGAPANRRNGKKGGNTYIVEDEDEPLDLLDRNALANISSTKPVKMRKPTKSKAKTDLDGKLILGKDSDDEMDVDGGDGAANGGSGVNAYVAALKGKDVARKGRGGKLKFSNKRGQDDDDVEDMDQDDAAAVKAQVDRSRGGGKPFRGRGPSRGGFSRGGRGGSGGRGGKGGIAAGRKGLGEDRRRGGVANGGVNKHRGRGGRR